MDLAFDKATHTYSLEGVRLPGVSEILDWAGFSPPYPRTGDYRARGSAVHKATLLYDQGKHFICDPRIDGYLNAYKSFREDFPTEWELMEVPAYHPTLLYAGILDRGKRPLPEREMLIADIKTGEPPKKRLGLQTAAYAMLHAGPLNCRKAQRMGVQLSPDGDYKIFDCNDPADFDVWTGLVHRYHWEKK